MDAVVSFFSGKVDQIRSAISGPPANTGDTIQEKAMNGDLQGILTAVENGADPNGQDARGCTAVFMASLYGRADVVEGLIYIGVDIKRPNREASPYWDVEDPLEGVRQPIHCAAGRCPGATVKQLLDAGAEVNATDQFMWTPLHFAARAGRVDCALELIRAGADVRAVDGLSTLYTPMHIARSGEMVTCLREAGADAEAIAAHGYTPLHRAAMTGEVDAVEALIKLRVNIDSKDEAGNTPLHLALESDSAAGTTLLTYGARVNEANAAGLTPLMAAAMSRDETVWTTLLDRGADMRAKDEHGNTALHRAVMADNADFALLLIDRGANKEALNKEECTPLQLAVRVQSEELVELLVGHGASAHTSDDNGRTPLHEAARDGLTDSLLETLLSSGADVTTVDKRQRTPLHNAERSAVIVLLQRRAVATVVDQDGLTPLHIAVMRDRDATELFLASTPDLIKQTDNLGRTPLHYARHSTVDLLLMAGADVNARDKDNRTALDLAICWRNRKVVKTLAARNTPCESARACDTARAALIECGWQVQPSTEAAVAEREAIRQQTLALAGYSDELLETELDDKDEEYEVENPVVTVADI